MKIRRVLSVFLLSILLTALCLTPQALALEAPTLDAKCALLMDETAGRMLYGHNEKEKAYPASITKIMTALLVLEAVDRGELLSSDKTPTGFTHTSRYGSSYRILSASYGIWFPFPIRQTP